MRDAVLGMQVVLADGRVITTGGRARKSSSGYDLTKLFVGSEGTLGVITELTVRLHGRPEAVAVATCHFTSIEAAVRTVITTIQLGIPVARIELLDEVQMGAVNSFSKLSYPEFPTLFFEFHGLTDRDVTEQADSVGEIAAEHGGQAFERAVSLEARTALWQARHDAYYAALAMRPGSRGWTTDACVPISRLADCILETKRDLEGSHLVASLVGHAGDGNFHLIFPVNPEDPRDIEEAERLSARLAERAIAMGGTCTGEHGVGIGKMKYLDREHGAAMDVMRAIKRTLDPDNIMNPGKLL
jgi:FAD/FMN-containing dehydrogenases